MIGTVHLIFPSSDRSISRHSCRRISCESVTGTLSERSSEIVLASRSARQISRLVSRPRISVGLVPLTYEVTTSESTHFVFSVFEAAAMSGIPAMTSNSTAIRLFTMTPCWYLRLANSVYPLFRIKSNIRTNTPSIHNATNGPRSTEPASAGGYGNECRFKTSRTRPAIKPIAPHILPKRG